MNVPTGSMSNTVIKEQQQSSKLILLFPEDGKQKDPDKSMEMMASYPVDGKLGSKVKDGKKLKSFQQDGKFKFNKKGKLKEREQIEIRRTSHNIFDWFNNGSKNINKDTTENKDEAKEAEQERLMTKINLKR